MMEGFLRDLQQPEYIHVLLNPLPVYGLALGLVGLLVGIALKSRSAQIATLTIVLLSAAIAWPVYEFGERSSDRVLSMSDDDGQAWLKIHERRAEKLIYFFYALALLSFMAIGLPAKFPKSTVPLAVATLLLGFVTLGIGGYIGYAGGKIRHREFRTGPPPGDETTPR